MLILAQNLSVPQNCSFLTQPLASILPMGQALIDSKKRRMFDALGSKGMQYVINPRSVSFQEILSNFGSASCWKRTKLAAIISAVFFTFLLQPILICVNIDKTTVYFAANPYWPWVAVLTPLWIFDAIVLTWLGSQFFANNIDQAGEEMDEGEEPSNTDRQQKRCLVCTKEEFQRLIYPIFRIFRHLLLVLVEIFLALKLDGVIDFNFSVVFTPLYLHQSLYLAQLIYTVVRTRADINRMVTLRYLERVILKRPYADLSDDEKKVVSDSFIIVHSPLPDPDDEEEGCQHLGTVNSIEDSEEFHISQEIALESQKKLFFFPFRAIFLGLLIPQLDNESKNWNWWFVFFPLWIVIFFSCCCILIDVAKSAADAMYIVKVAKNEAENFPDQPNEVTPGDAVIPEVDKKINLDAIPYIMKTQENLLDEENVASQVEDENMQQFPLMPLEDRMHSVFPEDAHKGVLIGNNMESQVETDILVEANEETRLSSTFLDEELQRGHDDSLSDGTDKDRQGILLEAAERHACEPRIEEKGEECVTSSELAEFLQHPVSALEREVLHGITDRSEQNFNIHTADTNVDLRPAENRQKDTSFTMEVNISTIPISPTNRLGEGQPIPDRSLSETDRGQEPPSTPQMKIEDDDDSYEYFVMSDENASKDVSRLAVERCCGLIWILIMACLFVGKLQGASYSALWIIFPILLPVS